MKRVVIILFVTAFNVSMYAQIPKWSMEKGIYISTPAHDDMWRSHRIGTGANWRLAYNYSAKISMGARLTYDYYWARKNFPVDYNGKPESKGAFTIAALKAGIQYSPYREWFYGLETGVGILHTIGTTRVGLGWVEEYDGWTKYGVTSSIYIGHPIFINYKNIGNWAIVWDHLYAERHAENFAGLRLNFNIKP